MALEINMSSPIAKRDSAESAPSAKRFHIALGVKDVNDSVREYSARLGCAPAVHVLDEYALWRTETLNFSIRRAPDASGLRHLGWEDSDASAFSEETDVNGLVWERFTAEQQREEIERHWPSRA